MTTETPGAASTALFKGGPSLAPGLPPGETVDFGHWNIGFCAWHRQCLREFEKALHAEVAGVTIPYWDWTDHVGAVNTLFTSAFLGSLRVGAPGRCLTASSEIRSRQPSGRSGGRRERMATRSTRCWTTASARRWLHHANVDRLWANWQAGRLTAVSGSTPRDHCPPPGELSPVDGEPAPLGHRRNDRMWPWVGDEAGYDVLLDPATKLLLPGFSGVPAVTVADVFDTTTIDAQGYRYAPPSA